MPDGPNEIQNVLETQNAVDKDGKYNNILAQILLKEAYDIEYGLYRHDDPALEHPLQTHLFTEKKAVRKFSPLLDYIRSYHYLEIFKYTGLNLVEFLNLPADIFDYITEFALENIRQVTEEKERIQHEEMKEYNRIDNGDKKNTMSFEGGF